MLILLLILVLTGAALTAVLWVGTLFFQGYIYTEPSAEIYWQAPAAGAALTFFFMLWCFLIAFSRRESGNLPYDTVFRFSPEVDMLKEPVKEIWAVMKKGETVHYKRWGDPGLGSGPPSYQYKDTKTGRFWNSKGAEAVVEVIRLVPHDGPYKGKEMQFKTAKAEEGGYRYFRGEGGWIIMEYDSPTGIPISFRFGRFLVNLFLNLSHLGMWFVCLWLLLRFQWLHSLGLAIVFWLIFSLALLPMVLDFAGTVAKR